LKRRGGAGFGLVILHDRGIVPRIRGVVATLSIFLDNRISTLVRRLEL